MSYSSKQSLKQSEPSSSNRMFASVNGTHEVKASKMSNGIVNGVANGLDNGVANGVDNGVARTKGLANGLANGVNGFTTEDGKFDDGALLKKVLEIVLREKLVTGIEESKKVVEFKQPEELKKLLDLQVGREGCSANEAEAIVEQVVRYSVRTTHPHFYNQLYAGIDEVALSGAWITEALNTNQYTFEVAPVFMLVEHEVIRQLVQLYGWEDGDGIFAPGGSMSNMYAMVLARYKKYPNVKKTGMFSFKPLVAFSSDQGHYSVSKSASWLGIGMDNVVPVATDSEGRMIPEALREAVKKVRAEGGDPYFVNATAGSTVFGAYDPLNGLADVCAEEGLWLHVDGCWGGAVVLSKKHKHLVSGINRVDSVAWNPHKMLGAALQCSAFVTRHKGLLHQCNSARASYLFQQDKYYDVSYDTGDKSVQCGRKVDAFKLWLSFKLHGMEELERRVDAAFDASRHLCTQLKQRQGFRLLQEPQCTNVCFWFIPPSLRNQPETPEWWVQLSKVAPKLKERMVKEGTMMVGYQPIASKKLVNFIRMVTTCTPTPTAAHMDFVLDEIERLGADL